MINNTELFNTKLEIRRFKPSFLNLYWQCYSPNDAPDYWNSYSHKIRMMLALIGKGYEVIYGIAQGTVIGHIVVDYNNKFHGQHSKDITLGPKWIIPSFRGKGYGSELSSIVLNELDIRYRCAYEIISSNNIASIKCATNNGYEFYSCAKRTRMGKFELCDNNSWYIYKRENKNYG